jgi:hypothetical protein
MTRHTPPRRTPMTPLHRRLVAGAGVAALGATLAACGSSSSGDSTNASGKGGACSPAAAALMTNYTSPPSSFPAGMKPLSKAPQPGGKLIRLYRPVSPSDHEVQQAVEDAAAAVGWQAAGLSYDGSVQDLQSKLAEAIAKKPTAIITPAGIEPALFQKSLDEAKAAGILVTIGYVVTPPQSIPGYGASAVTAKVQQTIGSIAGNWAVLDSGCKANVVAYGLAGSGASKAGVDSLEATLKANCGDCSVDYHEVPITAIGTPALGQGIVSTLQAQTHANYLYLALGNFNSGLSAQLRAAGLQDRVKVFGAVPDTSSIQGLVQKTNSMWVNNSTTMLGWSLVDALLRAKGSGQPTSDDVLPGLYAMTPQNIDGATTVPTYPQDYAQEWKKLWLVG